MQEEENFKRIIINILKNKGTYLYSGCCFKKKKDNQRINLLAEINSILP